MKSITKILLVGAVAVMAVAISAAPSEAKKRTKSPAPGTFVGELCSASCDKKTSVCGVNIWGADGKWYRAQITPSCLLPACPAACK